MANTFIEKVERSLQQAGLKGPYEFVNLPGDASSRSYIRVTAAENKTYIVMNYGTGPTSLAEEKTPGDTKAIRELPFVNVQRFLKSVAHVRVPEILTQGEGFLVLEDLGDHLLFEWVQRNSTETLQLRNWYCKSIDLLIPLQQFRQRSQGDCIAFTRCFDYQLYNWEFEHFVEYGIERLCGKLPGNARLREIFSGYSHDLAKLPTCFSHRDYHSKNLLITNRNEIAMIDFQDAIMAPTHYDLASLIFDAYTDLPEPLLQELIEYFYIRSDRALVGPSLDGFVRDLRKIALQRNLKAAGRFVYIFAEKKKATHVPFIIPSLRKAMRHLDFLENGKEAQQLIPAARIEDRAKELK